MHHFQQQAAFDLKGKGLLVITSLWLLATGFSAEEWNSGRALPATLFLRSPQEITAPPIPLTSAETIQILEPRRLLLTYPETLRVGDHGIIFLTLEVDPMEGSDPLDRAHPAQTEGETKSLPNFYASYAAFAEGWLDLAGVEIRPNPLIRTPLHPGQAVRLAWSIRPVEVGSYHGLVWLHVICKPKGSTEEKRLLLSAQRLNFRVVSLLGLSGAAARWIGAIGLLLGVLLSFDPFWIILGKLRKTTDAKRP